MRQNLALDTGEFKDFDAVHACLSAGDVHRPRVRSLGLGLVPHVIELLFLGLLECCPAGVAFHHLGAHRPQ
jgi:hypothetical protein